MVLLHFSHSEWKEDARSAVENCYRTFLLNLLTYDKAKFVQPENLDYVEEVVHKVTAENFPGLEDIEVEVYTTEDFARLEPKKHEVNLTNFPGLGEQEPECHQGKSNTLGSDWD